MAVGSTQLPIQWVPGLLPLEYSCRGFKLTIHLPSSAEVNVWSSISTPYTSIMSWCLVKHKDNFTITLPVELSVCRILQNKKQQWTQSACTY